MFGIFDDLFGDNSYYPYQYYNYPTRPRTAYRPRQQFNPFEAEEQPHEMDNDQYEQLYKEQEERYRRQKEEIERQKA